MRYLAEESGKDDIKIDISKLWPMGCTWPEEPLEPSMEVVFQTHFVVQALSALHHTSVSVG